MKIPQSAMLLASLGFEIVVAVLGGIGVGYLLDDRLGTSPILLIVGCLVGGAGAMVRLVMWAKRSRGGGNGGPGGRA